MDKEQFLFENTLGKMSINKLKELALLQGIIIPDTMKKKIDIIFELSKKYKESPFEYKKKKETTIKGKTLTPEEEHQNMETLKSIDPIVGNNWLTYLDQNGQKIVKSLLEHQKRFTQVFNYFNTSGVIAIHGVGTGKTLMTISTLVMYLNIYNSKNEQYGVIIVAPPAILRQWKSLILELGFLPNSQLIKFYTYAGFSKLSMGSCDKHLVIFEESHILRSNVIFKDETTESGEKERVVVGGKQPWATILRNAHAHKTLCLSATPFINKIYDIYNQLQLINQSNVILTEAQFKEYFSSLTKNDEKQAFKSIFDKNVDLYKISKTNPLYGEFPEYDIIYKTFAITKDIDKYIKVYEQFEMIEDPYTGEEKRIPLDPFNSVTRVLDQRPKINYCVDQALRKIIANGKEYQARVMFYTSSVKDVATKLSLELTRLNIPVAIVSGSLKQGIEDYNAGRINHIIITKAGTEGVDLKNTDICIIIEPTFNLSSIEQAMARSIRFRSHKTHHTNKVEVIKLLNIIPQDVDKIEHSLIEIKKLKIEKISYDDYDHTMNFDEKISWLSKLRKESRSVDFNLLLLSYIKHLKITQFIISIQKNSESFTSQYNTVMNDIEKYLITKGTNLTTEQKNKYINDYLNAKNKHKSKDTVLFGKWGNILTPSGTNTMQEFFTPPNIADELIDELNISGDKETYDILEPTAGDGALVDAITRRFKKADFEDKLYKVDAVEMLEKNIAELKNKYGTDPRFEIYQQDFLTFEKTKTYDYIIMNPPFNLKGSVSTSIELRRKSLMGHYYKKQSLLRDIHFIHHAVIHFLKDGGRCVAIGAGRPESELKALFKNDPSINITSELKQYKWKHQNKENEEHKEVKLNFRLYIIEKSITEDYEPDEKDNETKEIPQEKEKKERKKLVWFETTENIKNPKPKKQRKPEMTPEEKQRIKDDKAQERKRAKEQKAQESINIELAKINENIKNLKDLKYSDKKGKAKIIKKEINDTIDYHIKNIEPLSKKVIYYKKKLNENKDNKDEFIKLYKEYLNYDRLFNDAFIPLHNFMNDIAVMKYYGRQKSHDILSKYDDEKVLFKNLYPPYKKRAK